MTDAIEMRTSAVVGLVVTMTTIVPLIRLWATAGTMVVWSGSILGGLWRSRSVRIPTEKAVLPSMGNGMIVPGAYVPPTHDLAPLRILIVLI